METLYFHSNRGCLSYITYDPISRKGALIDPSEEIDTEEYLKSIKENNIELLYIIETHTHADHISSAKQIKAVTPHSVVVRHPNAPSKTADVYVHDGETLFLGDKKLTILHTPGHTNESVSIYNGKEVFTGDTLLLGGTGRTDFQVGDSEKLYDSIHEKIAQLPNTTLIRPGHNYERKNVDSLVNQLHTNERIRLCRDAFILYMNDYHPKKPELFDISIEKNSL